MQTGDGLLARLIPSGATVGLESLSALCRAAQRYGNGVIEITSRGSIQIRGLSAATAPVFAAEVNPLGIDCGDAIPVLTHPLSGLEAGEKLDVAELADGLREALVGISTLPRLSAKVSVIVDGAGALHLDDVSADVRLRGDGPGLFDVSLGGNAAGATRLGAVTANDAIRCVVRLLELLSLHSPAARMKAMVDANGMASIAGAVSDLLVARHPSPPRAPAQPIEVHALHDGRVALGVGMPFGHSNARALSELMDVAIHHGVSGVRTAPGHVLLLVGLPHASADGLAAQALSLGFITGARDPRRQVVACPGAPVCASGQIPARSLASTVAQAAGAAGGLTGGAVIHVSGCSKCCAHPSPSAVTVVGVDRMCDIQVDGVSVGLVTTDELPLRIHALLQSRKVERG
jgi:precorrin-3B synthase